MTNHSLPEPSAHAKDFIKTIYGCFDLDCINTKLIQTLPPVVNACGARLSFRIAGESFRSWTAGEHPPVVRITSGKHAQLPLRPLSWKRHNRYMWGRVFLVGRCEVVMVVRRREGMPPFNLQDEAWLTFTLEHAAKAMDRALRYLEVRSTAEFLASALELVPWPIAIVDDRGALLFRNQPAVLALSRSGTGDCIAAATDVLAKLPPERRGQPATITVPWENGWQLRALRRADGRSAVVCFRAEHQTAAIPVTLIGLMTRRESETATLVAKGMTNVEIATALCVTVHTVKRHLKSVFRKTGVSGRAELVVRLLQGCESERTTREG